MAAGQRSEIKRRLHDAGLRATAPRIAVLSLVMQSSRPLSHSDVVELLGSDEWDQATLYRNLVKLVEAGLLRVASRVGGIARYEASRDPDEPHLHPHFACRRCGTVACMPNTKLKVPEDASWQQALADPELQIVGLCPSCRRSRGVSLAG